MQPVSKEMNRGLIDNHEKMQGTLIEEMVSGHRGTGNATVAVGGFQGGTVPSADD